MLAAFFIFFHFLTDACSRFHFSDFLTDACGRFHFFQKSLDFQHEFVEMFFMDRLSAFDGIWAFPRHFLFDVSEQMFDRLLLRNFSC